MEKLLLKPSEVAQVLGIGRSLIYELIARNEIPSMRLGRCIRIPSESLQRWLKDQELQSKERNKQYGQCHEQPDDHCSRQAIYGCPHPPFGRVGRVSVRGGWPVLRNLSPFVVQTPPPGRCRGRPPQRGGESLGGSAAGQCGASSGPGQCTGAGVGHF